jgi:hypothetical protein
MGRPYDPDLDFLHVQRDGTILLEGEQIGHVARMDEPPNVNWTWRAERGNPAAPEAWPPYRASYGRTRALAVADVLEGLEVEG